VVRHSFRDEIDRIGVIEEPGVGTDRLYILDDTFHNLYRAQRHEEAARSLRFLANDAMFERNALVEIASLEAAGLEACQNGVTPLESFPALRGSSDRQIQAHGGCHLLGDSLNDRKEFCVKIDQDNLVPVEIFALVDK